MGSILEVLSVLGLGWGSESAFLTDSQRMMLMDWLYSENHWFKILKSLKRCSSSNTCSTSIHYFFFKRETNVLFCFSCTGWPAGSKLNALRWKHWQWGVFILGPQGSPRKHSLLLWGRSASVIIIITYMGVGLPLLSGKLTQRQDCILSIHNS